MIESRLSLLPESSRIQLHQVDNLWQAIRSGQLIPKHVIHSQGSSPDPQHFEEVDWDVLICGGTLGIFLGTVLVKQGWRVALLERGILRGRQQEWNISAKELQVFVELELLTPEELQQAMVSCFNPVRIGFHQGPDFWMRDVLNIGVDPTFLLDCLKKKFLALGGTLIEHTQFQEATVYPNGVLVKAGKNGETLFTTRLLIDAMGHFSPIGQQARQGKKPDGICLVVGGCASGFPEKTTGDLIYTFTPIQRKCQYFWEAFPAQDGRTTYLFTYLDPHPERLSMSELVEDYLTLLPEYQDIDLDQIIFKRFLFGIFPAFQESPLQLPWDRILPIGDSSGSQSPLSFGGFGSMVRHLNRLALGIQEALTTDSLTHTALAQLNPYQPNLSVTWLFQKTMSVSVGSKPDPNQINQLLSTIFQVMIELGDEVAKPFLQDVIQFSGLTQTLWQVSRQHPQLVAKLLTQLDPWTVMIWLGHYLRLGSYTGLTSLGSKLDPVFSKLPPKARYYWHRQQEAWRYGAGQDT
jgi:lycopene cyclase CruP